MVKRGGKGRKEIITKERAFQSFCLSENWYISKGMEIKSGVRNVVMAMKSTLGGTGGIRVGKTMVELR